MRGEVQEIRRGKLKGNGGAVCGVSWKGDMRERDGSGANDKVGVAYKVHGANRRAKVMYVRVRGGLGRG